MATPKRSVLITGCSLGCIGSVVAIEFHRRGFQVFATARTVSKKAHLKEIGTTILVLDVTSKKFAPSSDDARHV
ncbi:hypothetical protein V1504DRAFT_337336 [Lipomyces starkeyi]